MTYNYATIWNGSTAMLEFPVTLITGIVLGLTPALLVIKRFPKSKVLVDLKL